MCRHLGYLGEPVTLAELVLDPPHSLRGAELRPEGHARRRQGQRRRVRGRLVRHRVERGAPTGVRCRSGRTAGSPSWRGHSGSRRAGGRPQRHRGHADRRRGLRAVHRRALAVQPQRLHRRLAGHRGRAGRRGAAPGAVERPGDDRFHPAVGAAAAAAGRRRGPGGGTGRPGRRGAGSSTGLPADHAAHRRPAAAVPPRSPTRCAPAVRPPECCWPANPSTTTRPGSRSRTASWSWPTARACTASRCPSPRTAAHNTESEEPCPSASMTASSTRPAPPTSLLRMPGPG